MVKLSILIASLAISAVTGFAPVSHNVGTTVSLNVKKDNNNNDNIYSKFLTTAVASAILFTSTISPADAMENYMTPDFGGSDIILSARSGGRAGGRSSASSMRSPPPSARKTVNNYSSTTVVAPQRSAAIIAPPPIIAPVVVSPFGSPFGGFGYGAFGAVNAISNEMRDSRQENEIARERAELEVSKQRQAQLEQRLADLERREATTSATAQAALIGK